MANTRRSHDAVTLGALYRVSRPAPHGVDELGRRLIETHGGLEAALGFLALWLFRLEGRDR